MQKSIVVLSLAGALWMLVAACSTATPVPMPTQATTATPVATFTPKPPEPEVPTATPKPTPPPSVTAIAPTPTSTPIPSHTPVPPANTQVPATVALTPTLTPSPPSTPTPMPSPTPAPPANAQAPATVVPTPTPSPVPTPTPTIILPTRAPSPPNPLSKVERASRLEPEFASQLKALPWVADGIDDHEREAAQMLVDAANHYHDTLRALLQKPWVTDHDLTAAETNAVHGIRWAAKYAPALSERMLEIPWVQDGITEAEGEFIYQLYRVGQDTEELALALLGMPFLKTFDPDDALALSAIAYMGRRGEDHIEALKRSRIFKDGITDDLTTLVRAAGTIRDADALAQWLVPGHANAEVYTGQTKLTTELKISIFRDHGTPRPETMPELVRIVEQLESLMQVPLPNPRLVFVISDQAPTKSTRGISQGKRYDFAYGLRGDRENPERFASQYASDRPMLPSVMIHELGHDYFGNELKSWVNHTPVKTFEYVYRLDGRDRFEVPERVLNTIHQRSGCEARNIQHLEEMNPPNSDRANRLCHHYLGYWMGRELLEAVGQQEYFARMRRFWHLKERLVAEGYEPGIAEIRELFPEQLEIVERYWSGDVGNPEEKYWGGLANFVGDTTEHTFGCCCSGCAPTL